MKIAIFNFSFLLFALIANLVIHCTALFFLASIFRQFDEKYFFHRNFFCPSDMIYGFGGIFFSLIFLAKAISNEVKIVEFLFDHRKQF